MSTTIDQRVVEMRFDNKQFESNVQTSISTLEKLKQKLNLTGASKGLENLDSAAKKVNMGVLGSAADAVSVRFSAMQIAGITAMTRIANQAISTGEKMLSALTIDPIKTGFQEYETQMNAVQTILANTQSKGSTLNDVNKALDTLNTYADKTIYNFTEMTRNIGTFTAAGVDLQTSVDSIQGIANLAAVSGSTSQQASTAMYQLSQALAAGKVSLMDWNSVVNAGMGGELFQNALLRTSELLKTGGKEAVKTYGSFRESLTKGEWLTKEVLTETLKQLSGAYTEADLIAQGFTKDQAQEITSLAKTATDAATKVKTFTQLWDVMKESAQSGWSQTWKLIIGDFEQAKSLLTPLADFFTNVIGKMSDARNNLLEGALGKGIKNAAMGFDRIKDVLDGAKKGIDGVTKPIKDAAKSLEELEKIADKVIYGSFGNGADRFKALTEAGENYYRVQNKVNEKLGNTFRYTEEQIAAQDKVLGKQKESTDSTKKQGEATGELTRAEKMRIAMLAQKSEAELKSLGYSEKQIETLKEIKTQADKLGMSTGDFVNNLDEINGRWILWDSFKNIGQSIVTIFKSIGKAWRDAFPPMQADQLFNIIAGFHKFSTKLVISHETAGKLTRTLKGVFAILGMVSDVLGGGFKIAFKAVTALLSYFDTDILSVTAAIGDAIVAFRKATDITKLFEKALDFIIPLLTAGADAVIDWVKSFSQLPQVKDFINKIKKAFEDLKNLDFKAIGKHIVDGLTGGIDGGVIDAVKSIINLGIELIKGFCDKLGIFSPSRVFFEFGKNITQGLANGIGAGIKWTLDAIKNLGSAIISFFKNLDLSKIFEAIANLDFKSLLKQFEEPLAKFKEVLKNFDYKKLLAIIPIAAVLAFVKKIYDIGSVLAKGITSLNNAIEGFAKVEQGLANVLNSFSGMLKAKSQDIKAGALKKIAIAIAILVASIIALTFVDTDKLYDAVGVVITLALVLGGLMIAMDKFSSASVKLGEKGKGLNIEGLKTGLIAIGSTILLLAASVKLMGSMKSEEIKQGFEGLAACVLAIGAVYLSFGVISKFGDTANIDKAGGMILKISIAMLLMVGVAKLASKLDDDALKQAGKFALGFGALVLALCAISLLAGNNINKVGGMVLKITIAMGLMVGVCKLINMLEEDEIKYAAQFVAAFTLFVGGLVLVTKIGNDKQIAKLGGLLLSISISLILMVGICKLVGKLETAEMIKGGLFVGAFLIFVALLVKVTKIGPEQQMAKVAGTLLAASIAIGLLAGIAILLGMVPMDMLAKGVGAVTILGLMLAIMIRSTKGAEKVVGNLIVMTVAIAILAGAVAALSVIDPTKLAGATAALTTVMGMFTLLVNSAGKCNASIGPLITMTVAVGLLGGLIYLLAKLPIENVLGSAASLSMLLLAMSASMAIVSTFGSLSTTGIIALGAMTIVVGLLAGILYLIQDLPIETTMNNVKALSLMLLSMSGVLAILTIVGLGGPAALIGVGSLMGLIIGVGGLIAAIGALVTEFPKLEEFLNTGIPIIEKIGYALGSFFGNVVAGFAEGATSSLPGVGENLSKFMNNLDGFITGAKNIDEEALTGVSNLAKMMLMVTGASIVDKIASAFGDESSMATFSASLNSFADAIVEFSTKVKGNIDESSVLAAANAGKLLAEMNSKIPGSGGVVQWFCGEKNLATFGAQLSAFADAIIGFSSKVSAEGAINESAVMAAANAGKIMAEMQKSIVGTGGVIQWFCGEKDMATFGTQLVAFGNAIVEFSRVVSAEGAINENAILAASNAGKLMAEMQANIIPTGGVVQWFCGEQNLETFGTQLVAYGKAIVGFSDTVAGKIDEEAVTAAANAGRVMANVQKAIPEDKWFDGKISLDDFGKKIVQFGKRIAEYSEVVTDIDVFAVTNSVTASKRLVDLIKGLAEFDASGIENFKVNKLGSALKGYFEKISGVDFSTVSSSINSMTRLSNFVKSLSGFDGSGVNSFKAAITSLSNLELGDFSATLSESISRLATAGAEMVDSLVQGMQSKASLLTGAGTTLMVNVTTGINNSKNRVLTAVNNILTAMLNAIRSKESQFTSQGSALMNNFASGLRSASGSVTGAFTSVLSSAVASIMGYYGTFYSSGVHLVNGFVAGISDNMYKAEAKARAMANAAARAARQSLQINSPSKVFYQIGDYAGQGFVNALGDYGSKSYNAGFDMADSARVGLGKSIARINSIISGSLDYQPTIRPVLDLSAVSAGAGALSGMLDMNSSIGVLSNARSISSAMGRGQNGGNNDIISAIKDLKGSLNGISGNVYNIDGITYDDGSNIATAIETLVHAATMERRK